MMSRQQSTMPVTINAGTGEGIEWRGGLGEEQSGSGVHQVAWRGAHVAEGCGVHVATWRAWSSVACSGGMWRACSHVARVEQRGVVCVERRGTAWVCAWLGLGATHDGDALAREVVDALRSALALRVVHERRVLTAEEDAAHVLAFTSTFPSMLHALVV